MKLTKEHYAALDHEIRDTARRLGPAFTAQYIAGKFDRADRTKDVNKRYRWDLFWHTPASWRQAFADEVYTYCDDTHLDTALRRIVPSLPGV